jgi:predicted MFS family arabinose efflux permease
MVDLIDAGLAPRADPKEGSQEDGRTRRSSSAWGTAVLALIAMLAGIDRQAFAVLLVPIQKQIHVSDAAMGALTGTAFAIVYAIVALPLARLADRTNRRNMLALAVGVWGAATMVCGLAGSYVQLLLARVAVGSAESALLPTSMSMIADMYPSQRRGTAIGIVTVGSTLGFAAGSMIAGYMNDRFNWHIALMIVGAPGVVLALVLFLTTGEPVRGAQDGLAHVSVVARESLIECVRRCARIKTLYPFVIGWVFIQMCFAGWLTWIPAFLMRVDHLSATRMGAVFGVIIAGAIISGFIGGIFSDWLAKRGARWRLYFCCASMIVGVPLLVASTLVASLNATIALLIAYTLISGGVVTVATAAYVSFAPPTMRGFMSAGMNLFGAILGTGAGPTIFGAVNDVLKVSYGDQALRYTLLLAPATMAIGCALFFVASRTIDADVEAAVRPEGLS